MYVHDFPVMSDKGGGGRSDFFQKSVFREPFCVPSDQWLEAGGGGGGVILGLVPSHDILGL